MEKFDEAQERRSKDIGKIVEDGAVSVRELGRFTGQILREIEKSHKPVVITDHGKVVAVLKPTSLREFINSGGKV